MKASCGETKMKVILETGELTEVSKFEKPVNAPLMEGGLIFFENIYRKDKTGCHTRSFFLIILDTINEYRQKQAK